MKIAVYHNLPSGGGKRALYEMVRRLAGRNQIDLFAPSTADVAFCDIRPYVARMSISLFRPWPMLGSPFGRLNQLTGIANMRRIDAVDRRIAAQIDDGAYDLAFVHHCQFRQSPAVLRFVRTPTVYYLQEPPRWIYEPTVVRPTASTRLVKSVFDRLDPSPGLYRRALQQRDRRNTRAASLLLTNSLFTRESAVRIYDVPAKTCYLGVDTEVFRPLHVPKQNLVLSVGMLNPRKRFDTVIESLALVNASIRPRLVIVSNSGEPAETAFLQRLADEREVIVEFRRLLPDDELVHLYNQALATIYTPMLEPFGFVPLESMSCGTPVIGVNEGGVRETIVDGVTGVLVDRDPQLIAGVLAEWIRRPDMVQRMGDAGRALVQGRWTWDRTLSRLESCLAKVASSREKRT